LTGYRPFLKLYCFDQKPGPDKPSSESKPIGYRGDHSPWGIIGSTAKYFRISLDEILDMSYANLIMLFKTIPTIEPDEEKKKDNKGDEEEIDAADLGNFIIAQRQKNKKRKKEQRLTPHNAV